MPNGRPGDAPWSDFFVHKQEIFPRDISDMLNAIHAVSPDLIRHLSHPDMWEWEKGKQLDDARAKLRAIMEANDIEPTG